MPSLEQLYMVGAPRDEEKARMMADQLRGQRRAADMFSLSTVPQIAQQAQASSKNVLDAAERGGTLRQTILTREQNQRQHEERLNAQREGRQLQLTLQQMKADQKAAGKKEESAFDKMPVSVQKEYISANNMAEMMPGIIQDVENNRDAFGAYAIKSAHFPEATPNFLMEPLKSWEQEQFTESGRQARYNVYSRAYKIIHELAGAQVSAHEKARIEGFLPAPNDTADVVISKLRSSAQAAKDIQATNQKLYGNVDDQKVESLQETGEDDWQLQEDANGNRAEVNLRTGEIREIP